MNDNGSVDLGEIAGGVKATAQVITVEGDTTGNKFLLVSYASAPAPPLTRSQKLRRWWRREVVNRWWGLLRGRL